MVSGAEIKRRNKRTKEEVKTLMPNRGKGSAVVIPAGVPRRRVRIAKSFHHLLTERQRTVLRGKAKMPPTWIRIMKDIKENRMSMEEFVKTLSPEELVRGEIKDKNGRFTGRPPQWVPRAFHRACIAELMLRGKRLWQENYLEAIEAMTEIAAGRGKAGATATPGERIKAAQFVIERLEGKVPETLVVTHEQPWQVVMDGIVAEASDEAINRGKRALTSAQTIKGELEEEILEAEIIEDEPKRKDSRPPRHRSRSRQPR
jgi:hypothetical protein